MTIGNASATSVLPNIVVVVDQVREGDALNFLGGLLAVHFGLRAIKSCRKSVLLPLDSTVFLYLNEMKSQEIPFSVLSI
jgi:hypothetical protein